MTRLAARLLLDLGGVKESGNDCGGADPDRDAGLDQLGPALLARSVVRIAHAPPSMAFGRALEAE
jgi:hypothetical protein